MENKEEKVSPLFWGQIVKAGETSHVEQPENVYTVLTAACLADIPSDNKVSVALLKGKVKTVLIDQIDPKAETDPITIQTSTFAKLIPNKHEHVLLHHVFSPLNELELEASGPYDIHISGYYQPFDEEEEIPEFEEDVSEEEEDLDEEKAKEKALKLIKSSNKKDE